MTGEAIGGNTPNPAWDELISSEIDEYHTGDEQSKQAMRDAAIDYLKSQSAITDEHGLRTNKYLNSEQGKAEQAIEADLDDFTAKMEKGVAAGVISKERANEKLSQRTEEATKAIDDVRQDYQDRQSIGTREEQDRYNEWLESVNAENTANLQSREANQEPVQSTNPEDVDDSDIADIAKTTDTTKKNVNIADGPDAARPLDKTTATASPEKYDEPDKDAILDWLLGTSDADEEISASSAKPEVALADTEPVDSVDAKQLADDMYQNYSQFWSNSGTQEPSRSTTAQTSGSQVSQPGLKITATYIPGKDPAAQPTNVGDKTTDDQSVNAGESTDDHNEALAAELKALEKEVDEHGYKIIEGLEAEASNLEEDLKAINEQLKAYQAAELKSLEEDVEKLKKRDADLSDGEGVLRVELGAEPAATDTDDATGTSIEVTGQSTESTTEETANGDKTSEYDPANLQSMRESIKNQCPNISEKGLDFILDPSNNPLDQDEYSTWWDTIGDSEKAEIISFEKSVLEVEQRNSSNSIRYPGRAFRDWLINAGHIQP